MLRQQLLQLQNQLTPPAAVKASGLKGGFFNNIGKNQLIYLQRFASEQFRLVPVNENRADAIAEFTNQKDASAVADKLKQFGIMSNIQVQDTTMILQVDDITKLNNQLLSLYKAAK